MLQSKWPFSLPYVLEILITCIFWTRNSNLKSVSNIKQLQISRNFNWIRDNRITPSKCCLVSSKGRRVGKIFCLVIPLTPYNVLLLFSVDCSYFLLMDCQDIGRYFDLVFAHGGGGGGEGKITPPLLYFWLENAIYLKFCTDT